MRGPRHDEVRSLLPEYRGGSLEAGKAGEVENHLRECRACRQALSGIEILARVEVPDPGEAYWGALPLRVRAATLAPPPSRFLFRWAVPAAAALIAVLVFTLRPGEERLSWDPLFHDPWSATVLEYRHLTEGDIPNLIESGEGAVRFTGHEHFTGYSYIREMVSLSSEELQGLDAALDRQQSKGGTS